MDNADYCVAQLAKMVITKQCELGSRIAKLYCGTFIHDAMVARCDYKVEYQHPQEDKFMGIPVMKSKMMNECSWAIMDRHMNVLAMGTVEREEQK